jgi:hypothetical protein
MVTPAKVWEDGCFNARMTNPGKEKGARDPSVGAPVLKKAS